jgi:transcriptional regulator GlxA family with amidase domain
LSRVLFQRLAADVRRELAGNERLATCSTVRVNEATWQLLSSVLEEAYNPGPASETLVRAAIEQCVIALLRPPKAPARAATAPRHDARLSRAISYMENHLDEELSLRQLAAIASLSRYHFSRRFQEQYGISPHRYLVHLRVKRAALLLQSSDLNVTEIALEVGYDSPGNFIRHFRERFGVTPLAYRRRPRPARFV